jgi:hypothetical protein
MGSVSQSFTSSNHIRIQRGLAFGIIIVAALFAFEIFNYSTTVFALSDLLGDLKFAGIKWATILAIAFCCIDFAGIARLFTPTESNGEVNEVWYLFGAWLLAATMNAMLTWWGISIAILNHETLGNAVIDRPTLLRVVPIFVAVLVWLIRVLIIGTFSVAGDRLFTIGEKPTVYNHPRAGSLSAPGRMLGASSASAAPPAAGMRSYSPAPKVGAQSEPASTRPEPTYHSLSMSGSNQPAPGVRTLNASGQRTSTSYHS